MTRKPVKPFSVVDLFAGCGGSTTGMRKCFSHFRQPVKVTAINHWQLAVETHEANHPDDMHLCTGVDDVDIKRLIRQRGRPKIVWGSPVCTFFSRARGGKPYRDQQRSLAECLVDWAREAAPEIILVENVKEFVDWGPLRQKKKNGVLLWIKIVRPDIDTRKESLAYRAWKTKHPRGTYAHWKARMESFMVAKTRYIQTEAQPPISREDYASELEFFDALEAMNWGPAQEPDPAQKGVYFKAWQARLEAQGYITGYKFLRACDFGDTTTRERFFFQAHRVDTKRKVMWPAPTRISRKEAHKRGFDMDVIREKGIDVGGGRHQRLWKSAADHVIDWTKPGTSIYDRKKPLSEKTMRRIFEGLKKFGLRAFVTPGQGERAGQTPRTHDAQEPIPTACANGHMHLVEPRILNRFELAARDPALRFFDPEEQATFERWKTTAPGFVIAMEHGGRVVDAQQPLPVITTARGGAMAAVTPFILPTQSGEKRARDIQEPVQVITTESRGIQLIQPMLVEMRGTSDDQIANSAKETSEPIGTVTAGGGHHAVVSPYLIQTAHGDDKPSDSNRRVKDVHGPLGTVTASGGDTALVQPFLVQTAHGAKGKSDNRAKDIHEPLATVSGNRGSEALCTPFIMSAGGPECPAVPVTEPVGTILTRDHRAIVTPGLLPQQSDGVLRPITEPTPTIAASGAIALVEPFLVQFYGTGHADSVKDPLATVTTKGRHGLVRPEVVTADGKRYQLDIRFRMLQPEELMRAHSFPKKYKFLGTKTDHIRMVGNSNPVYLTSAVTYAAYYQDENYQEFNEQEN